MLLLMGPDLERSREAILAKSKAGSRSRETDLERSREAVLERSRKLVLERSREADLERSREVIYVGRNILPFLFC